MLNHNNVNITSQNYADLQASLLLRLGGDHQALTIEEIRERLLQERANGNIILNEINATAVRKRNPDDYSQSNGVENHHWDTSGEDQTITGTYYGDTGAIIWSDNQ